jgi:hypothetical protein
MQKRGRPPLTDAQAAEKAAKVINLATALRIRFGSLTPAQRKEGMRAVFVPGTLELKRYRGRVGEFIGDSLQTLFPKASPLQWCVSIVIDYKIPIYRAAKWTGVDAPNLTKAVQAERELRAQLAQVTGPRRRFESKEINAN